MWRWLRNHGFAVTAEQRLDRWNDIGGPKRLERWALQSRSHFLASRALNGVSVVAGVLITSRILGAPADITGALVAGALLGTVVSTVAFGNRQWHRDRDLYEGWLRTQERRLATQRAAK